jgi:hypothetical protein
MARALPTTPAAPNTVGLDLPQLRANLQTALLAGGKTAGLRSMIATMEAHAAAEAAATAEADLAAKNALHASVVAAATAMAAACRTALAGRLATLQPPDAPAGR